jgi:epoxyqueuosine reductase
LAGHGAGAKELVRGHAISLGFSKAGFAACGPFDEERGHLDEWFSGGSAGPLGYLSPEMASGHMRAFPEAVTAMVAFFPYARPGSVPGAAPGSLRLSRYLWGPDYHRVIRKRLLELLGRVQCLFPSASGLACVDTAPIMERCLAVRAGLGWRGKNTLLIASGQGSWGFLGVLLLSVELEPDPPFAGDRCGTCSRCIDVCPTGALSPFRLDCSRCLSTWNIEREGPPGDVAGAISRTGWVAGCDICQEVCPWNRRPAWGDPGLWGGASPLHTGTAAGLRMAPGQWKRATAGTALARVRHRHWNATLDIAAGG